MKIVVASNNSAKIMAVKTTFSSAEVVACQGESAVSSKPINYETFLGAYNRVNSVTQPCDLVVAVEGGYFIVDDKYYVVDVACIKDSKGYRFGHSDFFEISKNMYNCIQANISLNDIILGFNEFKESYSEFKEKYGIIGYLSRKSVGRAHGSIHAVKIASRADYLQVSTS